ncbi:DUF1330 domain-containing protein [Bradyrhizobium sp. USDA 4452]
MAKGYWITRVDVYDAEQFERYKAANVDLFARYGARFLVRGGAQTAVEGSARGRNVVIEFPSYRAALECWHSADYAGSAALRRPCSAADIVIVEGVP